MIRNVTLADAQQIVEIYNHYVTETITTFEEEPATAEDFEKRIQAVLDAGKPWIVEEVDGNITGYAYAAQWRNRAAYRFTVESAVYVDHTKMENGTGTRLYAHLIDELKKLGMHSIMGVVSVPNEGSRKLHEKFGFKKIAQYKEAGWKFEQWIDVVCWQLML